MSLTLWSKRIGIICLSACFFVAVICRETTLAGTIVGGLLILINPKD
jgi:hypothetical protein